MKRSVQAGLFYYIATQLSYMFRYFYLALPILLLVACENLEPTEPTKGTALAFLIGTKADPLARLQHDLEMLVDPSTGELPRSIRKKELAFFRKELNQESKNLLSEWENRGPWNVGGRTRAFAIDVSNPNIMLAGAASGGIWKSVDAGQNWYKVTGLGTNTAVTSLIQDPRPGHEQDWYFTTGELFGASQSAVGAFYLGNGVYKSTDGGESWEGISSTQANSPQSFNNLWEGLWRIAIDPSNLDETELYVAGYGAIYRSSNGGDSWTTEISSSSAGQASYFTDVTVTDSGVVYATLSYENEIISFGLGPNGSIYRSEDGMTFTEIRPDEYPERFSRTVIGVNPTDQDEVYFLAANVDSLSGFQGEFFNGGVQYSSLWRYNYLSGDGSGAGGQWTELTENLPADTGIFDDFYPQSGYDLSIGVSPDDPQTVLIGGTNLYRSTDGFTTTVNNRFIGGYAEHSSFPDFEIYENHHPDIHGMQFVPGSDGVVYNYNDGGIYLTNDIWADTVEWTSLNQGYLTTQVYGLGVEIDEPSAQLVAGMQDNGNHYVNDYSSTAPWTLPLNGDGTYTYFARENDFVTLSIQNGRVFKCLLSESGELSGFERIDPGLEPDGHDFIHPYAHSPNDDGTLFFPYENRLYVHRGIDTVIVGADYEADLEGWELFADSVPENLRITSISPAEDGTERIYLGTNEERIYRIDDATDNGSAFVDVTLTSMPNAHIDCIAVDPLDSDKAMVVFTNYSVYSLYYTEDAGDNWVKVAGNLEQNSSGSGNGPSCRWATIHRWHPDSVVYFVGTSVGLFSTSSLNGIDTEWFQESPEGIGNTVVSYVVSREVDRKVFAGTHGGGVFQAEVESLSLPSTISEHNNLDIGIYPNPTNENLTVDLSSLNSGVYQLSIIDPNGSVVLVSSSRGGQKMLFNLDFMPSGIYFLRLQGEGTEIVAPFSKTR
ncbi:MAG: T9SS type A sorting domain-containing protein [Flavobacteriales bacterium]|nr:T9SS type A sorting domain-containing protein [Flavobacteriales bacterium]